MTTATIDIKGIPELQRKLGRIASMRYMQTALKLVGDTVAAKAGKYPPASSANTPQPNTAGAKWYERGFGQKWANVGTRGGSYRRTSEVLSKRWYVRSWPTFVGIANTASYARYVHGYKQPSFHRGRGWLRLDKVAEDELPNIVKTLQRQIDREIAR